MPAPATYVFLQDEDADLFPVRLEGQNYSEESAREQAFAKAKELVEDEVWVPAGELTFAKIQRN